MGRTTLENLLQNPPSVTDAWGQPNGALIIVCIIAGLYFFPFLTALLRGKNPGGVFIINLVIGWSVIGWLIALVMACGQKPVRAPRPPRMTAREFIDESRDLWRESRREPRL